MPGRTARPRPWHFALLVLLSPAVTEAREDPSDLCLRAASRAAKETGVPYDVLLAISKVETARDNRPWPWTVNFGGDGKWFDSAAEAEAGVNEALKQGSTNVDLGCFQLNYRWHSGGFASIADMLEPDQNAAYAARFLADQYRRTGDWAKAAAAYHSATPEHAETYQAKFEAVYASLDDSAPAPEPMEPRENRFPLLVGGTSGSGGSLFPAASGGTRLIGGP